MISKSNFISEHIKPIEDEYRIIKELGHGAFGQVVRIQNIENGNIYACKKMNKREIKDKERFKTEIELLRATDHPNIIKLYDIYENKIFIYLIMEECLGGEFFDRLAIRAKRYNMYTEKEACNIFKQILEAVNYLHAHGICHRDLKPENILFSSVSENSALKLIDFGLSQIFNEDTNMKESVGTSFYMAPEVINGDYNEKCDIWSCGVILYIMLCGKPPFYSNDNSELKSLILNMKYDFNYPEFNQISKGAKELIKSMLVEASQRPSASEVLENPWIKQNAPNSSDNVLSVNWFQIKKYTSLNLMQKCVINFTAFRLTEKETRQFVEIFKSFDENSDGVLSMEEIKKGLEMCPFGNKFKSSDVIKMFNEMDVDKNGLINFTEFVSAMMDYEKVVKKNHLLECFKNYDVDGNGTISFDEFCEMINPSTNEEKENVFKLFKQFDTNNDNQIDFDEFYDGFFKNKK